MTAIETLRPQAENHESFLARFSGRMRPDDIWLVDFAYRQAKYGHRNQVREGGGRYFEHCRSTALIHIDELGITDPDIVVSDLLHDIPEDSWLLTVRDIAHVWNSRVAAIVDAVTKRDGEHILKYVERVESVPNADAILVKLADRLHNVRTLGACSSEKRARKISETEKYYLPLIPKLTYSNQVDAALRFEKLFDRALKDLAA